MLIIPAIDIIDGKIVRLSQGRFESKSDYVNTPLDQAKIFEDNGFKWIHIVDLLGSKNGKVQTLNIIEKIKTHTKLKIEFGGGIRSVEDVRFLESFGVNLIIVGSLAIINKTEFEKIFDFVDPQKILVAADVIDYQIQVKGWTENSNIHLFDHIEYCKNLGVNNFLCTDIRTDGMLSGTNKKLYENIFKKFNHINLTASGGVGCLEDIVELNNLNLRGVVVGKAIYENKINLKELSKLVT